MFSHLSLVWAKTLSSATWVCTVTSSLLSVRMFIHSTCTQSVRFAPIALGLVISFASDARYSISDVRVTLPGYLALLLHVLSAGASEHLRAALLPSMGAKYVSVFCTIGAATFGLIIYATTEILVSIFTNVIRVV